ncbi:hypothetical protein, partial [Gordonia sp. NPDC003585]|uniref:hypothetical protein n=1 Tax=Gordonia sp. NPDC003585 TaxID=3154275 RepID=UPI0033BA59BE
FSHTARLGDLAHPYILWSREPVLRTVNPEEPDIANIKVTIDISLPDFHLSNAHQSHLPHAPIKDR